jgi:small-conductance mechanosensitive channel
MLEPAPRAVLKEFGDSSIRYELSFWVEREEYLFEAADAVRTAIWQEAQKRSLTLPCVASTAASTQGNKPALGTA